jgi:hypothetical protein
MKEIPISHFTQIAQTVKILKEATPKKSMASDRSQHQIKYTRLNF